MTMSPERWQRLQELFAAALPLAPEARARLLDEQCDDEELRRDVESLVRAAESAGGFLTDAVMAAAEQFVESGSLGIIRAGRRPAACLAACSRSWVGTTKPRRPSWRRTKYCVRSAPMEIGCARKASGGSCGCTS